MKLAAIALAAAVQAQPAPSEVQLAESTDAVAKCERLGEVKGGTALGGVFAGSAPSRALKKLKESAGKLGATHVLLLTSSAGYSGAHTLGIAYRCPQPAPDAPT